MKLELTNRNLSRISEMPDPAVEDVLNFIYDFCHDIKTETGLTVDKLACRDEDALFRRLPWLGRTVEKIGNEKESCFSKPSRLEKLEEIAGRMEKLDREIGETQQLRNRHTEELQHLEQKYHQLDAEKQQEKDLQAEIDELHLRIHELEALDLDELTAKKAEAEAEKARLTEQQEALQEEIRQQEEQIASIENETLQTNETLRLLSEEAEQKKESRSEAENRIAGLKEENGELLETCRNLDLQIQELESSVRVNEEKREQLQAMLDSEEMKLKKLDAQATLRKIDLLRDRLNQFQRLNENLTRDWNSAWGQEQRGLNPQLAAPSELLKKEIAETQERFKRYRSDLQKVINFLSSDRIQ